MNKRAIVSTVLSACVVVGVALAAGGCYGVPKGTLKEVSVGAVQLTAEGAGIVKADALKTTFKIRCAVCGYLSEEITIDTPVAGKPYVMDWVCPKCDHKQKVVIQAVIK